MAKKRIVVVGAGFGGMAAVRSLKHADADVTLIDRTNHHLFQPLLYQVATAALSPADIATASRALLRRQKNATVIMGQVTGVDAGGGLVKVVNTPDVPFDYLVLATGAAYSFFGKDHWAVDAPVLKSLTDALTIRERLLGAFEWAESHAGQQEVGRMLTFVVVGGGPTGVELAGTIAELSRSTLAHDFRHIDPASARIILFEAGPCLLSAFPDRLSDYARTALEKLGVEVRTATSVNEIDGEGLTAGAERVETTNILWCAGTAARPAAEWLGAEAARNGAVKVRGDCSVPGHPNIFALGDVSSLDGGNGRPLAGLAPVAKQQGAYVGRLLRARIAGRPDPAPFRYRDLGTMAVIGRSRAVADFGWCQLTGFPAWLTWSLVHLMLLVDFRSRLMVYTNWSWAWFTNGRGARLVTRSEHDVEVASGRAMQTACPGTSATKPGANQPERPGFGPSDPPGIHSAEIKADEAPAPRERGNPMPVRRVVDQSRGGQRRDRSDDCRLLPPEADSGSGHSCPGRRALEPNSTTPPAIPTGVDSDLSTVRTQGRASP